ncbi:1-aminocyclopropane-1-carboxylate synthase-like protein 1 [Sphaeramia orbicularis]|uniref:1-aminocyclopropane-1-carboxylate synthase-like protein 1 n=1 Tax=Sphaeramia orbicularis TaxID=375764 RepID=A0A673BUH1_9TELE|nr:1-aminocyclopropane-1-carboxylate synthase-like protein 1 [Sphaeramia orbicularis]XP_029992953.1 1-aminocyclopropane-1-carboxylate synthase-like protein 1 [Sphaeramia orbicularis]XP_029992954.1 1-aminocyclopropane-1-carboxylate synthase-like protein 1 [Sphaeramia orbicularis]XP_029992955.1 1-aminocyclopropane-1-carboxylate synthase-like protein 1 [Sphaeramia orbicularis]XP_029992957.1 1-aminocyclopropane-1-carboxylate synthase-like protein 1 [Sphaeramia orbicularis]
MDFRGRRHERGSNWTDPEIVELLQLWSDESVQIELESSLRNQRVFDRIAHILREKGIYRTGDQCREKIKKMKLEYRRIKDNHKMRSWKFYDVMDRVLANRPAITYSSLGGAVIAQQVFQSPGGSDGYLQGVSASAFGPTSSGGFLFGQPPKPGDPLDIKCEDVEESMLNSGVAPPEMYYGSGDDHETDGQSILGPEDTLGQGEGSTNARISPSGFSDLNIVGSATAGAHAAGGPLSHEPPEQSRKEGPHPTAAMRQRKRRRAGKASCTHGGARCGSQGRLDKALASFLNWQQSAEERLLSLEEARLERELQAEEQREQREERRAEQERQHELRLFSMLTGALVAVRQGAQASTAKPDEPSVSPPANMSASLLTTVAPSVSSSLSPHPSETPTAQVISTQETTKSAPPTSVKACEMSQNILATLRGAETPGRSVYLSNRGNSIRQHQGILQEGYAKYGMDRHHDTDNPNGIINMGTSENKLCYDLLHKRLTKPDMLHINPSLLQYSDWTGHAFLREEVAKFLSHYCCSPRPLKADSVVVMNGCGSLFSSIAAVICDPKDAILIPTPFYGVITEDLHLYSDVRLFHVPLDPEGNDKGSRPFQLTVGKLEDGLKRAKQEGFIIRAVILMNPHNPLAEIYTQKEMIAFLEFAKRNELHAIVDEVYMLTVFDESVTFHSVLSMDSLPDPQRTHVMWGMSKDFAMAGIRIGTLYTENADLVEALAQLGSFHGIPGSTQHQVAQLLQDREWISVEFLPENRSRLKTAHSYLTQELRAMGIPYLDRPAALYVWADLRKYLKESTFEEELSLWRCFLRHKVVLSCGQAFSCSTPGWFRIVFADQQHHLELGLKRIREALKEIEEEIAGPDSHSIKEAIEESKKSVKEDSADTDNAAFVNSTPSPRSKSSDRLKEKDSPVPDSDSLATEEFVLLDCQASKPADGLESLIGTLRHQLRSSDWLEKNTPETAAGEDPEIRDVFLALMQRARK